MNHIHHTVQHQTPNLEQGSRPSRVPRAAGQSGHRSHWWMMILMCVPIIAFGLWQLATAGTLTGLFAGLVCVAMMAVMHLGMGGHKH